MTWASPWTNDGEQSLSTTYRTTDRDREILSSLCVAVRLFSQSQIATHWFENDKANTRRRMRILIAQQFVTRIEVRAKVLPELTRPAACWRVGEPTPSFSTVACQLKARWRHQVVRTLTAYVATEDAARLFGGKGVGELRKPTQAGHDLGLSQVWLRFASTNPAWARAWRGEDVMAHTRRGEKLPDAFIVNANNQVACLIEFGGAYDQDRLIAFHNDCVERQLPYQIW